MDFWDHILSTVRKHVNQQCFETWFKPISCHGCANGILRLTVPNGTFKKCLLENYSDLLLRAAAETIKFPLNLEVLVDAAFDAEPASPVADSPQLDSKPLLIPKYTFDSFVVGTGNQMAHAAARAVAERPSKAYNPLCLYGGVGLGKTHLMHAIGNLVQTRNKSVRLAYRSSEEFMNELVDAIRFEGTIQFRQKYRNVDILLIDDIQFMAGKERTQEEFFHTFNALYDSQKQIVITSDCPPKQIPTLEERLHSRFEWGLTANIQPPDLETRIAILKKKAAAESLSLRDDVVSYIAGGIRSSVRELEVALNRLGARASLDGLDVAEVDVSYARDVLKDIVGGPEHKVSPERILQAVASFYSIKPAQLKLKNNSRPIAVPRQIAMYLCKELTKESLPQIGREFGGKHHATVLRLIRKIDSLKKKGFGNFLRGGQNHKITEIGLSLWQANFPTDNP
jgi:chromosomal replication initiator protein